MLDSLKILLRIDKEDYGQDEILMFCLDSVQDAVKNYCNRPDMPSELKSTIIRMAAGYYAACGFGTDSTDVQGGALLQTVTSVERGDVKTSFGSGSAAEFAASAAGGGGGVMDLLGDYKVQLNRFRRLRW